MPEVENILGNFGVITALVFIGILIFAECAFLFGLFVPGGDVLLLASGVFAAEGNLPLAGLLIIIFVAAFTGYEVGYVVGQKGGPKIFHRKGGHGLREEHLEKAKKFYENHGAKTILIARFIGYIRTLAPLFAGMTNMNRGKFVFYNFIGSLLWTFSLVLLGYWLGASFIAEFERYSLPLTVVSVVILFLGIAVYFVHARSTR